MPYPHYLPGMNSAIEPSEQYLRFVLDASPAMMWVTRPDGYCTYLSKPWFDFTGRSFEQDLGLGWTENVHPEDREAAGKEFIRCSDGRLPYKIMFRLRRHDGVYRWVIDQGNPTFSNDGTFVGFVGLVMDVHDQQMSERHFAELRNRFLRAAEATDLGIWYCDLPFSDLIWNKEVKNHFWLPEDPHVDIELFYERIHPDDRQMTKTAIEASIANHTPYQIDYRTTNPLAPEQIKWIRAIGWTDYDQAGNPIRFDGITLDVSDEIKLNQELNKALVTRDEFLSVASHELKTPLTALLLHSQILGQLSDKGVSDPLKLRSISQRTDAQVRKLTRLVDDMLDISRIRTGRLTLRPEPVDLKRLLDDVLQKMTDEFQRAEVAMPRVDVPGSISGNWDPMRLEQVLMNLLSNALRYGNGADVGLSVEKNNEKVRVAVLDKGPGIDSEMKEKIFYRFVRDIPSSEVSGLGLGLYISKQIIEGHKGRIWVEDNEGGGSRFLFELPL